MVQALTHEDCLQLADSFSDTPDMVITSHLLRRNLCRAYLTGDPVNYSAAVVQNHNTPDEPAAYGTDPEAIWALLKSIPGWFCVNVSLDLAESLAQLIECDWQVRVRHYGDVYFSLTNPVDVVGNESVRLMTLNDVSLLKKAPDEARTSGFGDVETLLREGFVACAVVDGQIVAMVETYARSQKYAEIGVGTLAAYRKRGYATAAASLVAERVQADGQTPVWSTGEDNYASMQVAKKLGFQEVSRRVYLILN